MKKLLTVVGMLALAVPALAQPVMEAVVGNNFGHLPMIVGVEKGLFKKHGVDLKLKVVNTGTDMVNAMTQNEVQFGDMSVTTFLKALHAGAPFLVVGMTPPPRSPTSRSPSSRARARESRASRT